MTYAVAVAMVEAHCVLHAVKLIGAENVNGELPAQLPPPNDSVLVLLHVAVALPMPVLVTVVHCNFEPAPDGPAGPIQNN